MSKQGEEREERKKEQEEHANIQPQSQELDFTDEELVFVIPNPIEEVVKVVALKGVDQAIEMQNKDPDVINEIIAENRNAELNIVQIARFSYLRLVDDLNDVPSSNKLYIEEQKFIKEILKDISVINGYINTTEQNIKAGVSSKRNTKFDQQPASNNLSFHSQPKLGGASFDKFGDNTFIKTYSLDQLKTFSKQIKETKKIWQELSQMKNDTDRSFGYRKLSDNLASMAMTGINTGRQGIAFAQALLTYAVVDVLYTSLVKGTLKGAAKGFKTGYSGTNKGIKSAANVMYVMMDRSEKNLEKAVSKIYSEYHTLLTIDDFEANSAQVNGQNILEQLNKLKDESKLDQTQYDNSIKLLSKALENAPKYEPTVEVQPKPNLATKGVAVLGGIVGGVVVGITNAIWEGVKNPAKALTKDAPNLLKQQYNNIKPQQGTSWNKDRAQVKEELQTKRKAKSMIGYAKKTDTEGKFTQMVDKQKEAAKQANGKGAKGI